MTKQIIIKGKKNLAEYYFNREFSSFDFSTMQEMQKAESGYINVQNPSDVYYFDEFSSNRKDCETISTVDELEERNYELFEEFEEYREQEQESNYPMWGTVWKIDGNSWQSDHYVKNIDKLAEIGIGLLEFKDEYYLFIAGAGYDFYEAHWIPLFTKFFKWIDEDCK